ncbi:MAG: hypothetical protein EAX90_04520 [Candidatus Heimdallarchaeota archaeon]|nr:hypothetical protein [Candidatus Heimdallarchaeota archaeon]
MKIGIIYFSGTGVTAKFASEIAQGFQNNNHSTELIRLKRVSKINLSSFDIIGFGSPTYSFRAPWLVTRLLRKLELHNKPFFLFSTSGGMPGNTIWNLFYAVKRKGGKFLGFIEGVGTTNLRSWMPHINSSSEPSWGLSKYDCQRANEFGEIIINNFGSTKKSNQIQKPKPYILLIIWSWFFTLRFEMALTAGIKYVDKNKCTKCNLCETKICPSNAIKIGKNGFPIINEFLCVGCNGCINLCQENAILSLRTRKHKQYKLYRKYILK